MIAMVFTGGTISMRVDPLAGGAVPALDARDILSAARGIEDVAPLRIEEWGRFPGPHMDTDRMWALRARLIALVAEPGIDGVVVTHGTDTIEETAYLIARSVPTAKPIVFTGAMRNLSELGWDGPSNLVDAVRVAAHPEARGYGVFLVMNGRRPHRCLLCVPRITFGHSGDADRRELAEKRSSRVPVWAGGSGSLCPASGEYELDCNRPRRIAGSGAGGRLP